DGVQAKSRRRFDLFRLVTSGFPFPVITARFVQLPQVFPGLALTAVVVTTGPDHASGPAHYKGTPAVVFLVPRADRQYPAIASPAPGAFVLDRQVVVLNPLCHVKLSWACAPKRLGRLNRHLRG